MERKLTHTRQNTGEQVVKCKGFTLNKLASDQLTLDAMRHMVTSYTEDVVSIKVNQHTIRSEAKKRRVCSEVENQKFIGVHLIKELGIVTTLVHPMEWIYMQVCL